MTESDIPTVWHEPQPLWGHMCEVSRRGDETQFRELWHRLVRFQTIGLPFLHTVLGQSYERTGEYLEAIASYRKAIELMEVTGADLHGSDDPHPAWWAEYFARNNLGYCLSLQEEHTGAEQVLREATQVKPDKGNAWKNLGISLEKQGRIFEAASIWMEGSFRDPTDRRSVTLLTDLVEGHPELHEQIPDLDFKIRHLAQLTSSGLLEATAARAFGRPPR